MISSIREEIDDLRGKIIQLNKKVDDLEDQLKERSIKKIKVEVLKKCEYEDSRGVCGREFWAHHGHQKYCENHNGKAAYYWNKKRSTNY